jgi:hypothetical protein
VNLVDERPDLGGYVVIVRGCRTETWLGFAGSLEDAMEHNVAELRVGIGRHAEKV